MTNYTPAVLAEQRKLCSLDYGLDMGMSIASYAGMLEDALDEIERLQSMAKKGDSNE